MTYALFAIAVVVAAAAVSLPTLRTLRPRPLLLAGLVLMALTLVFDNILVGSGIVAYDEGLISGIRMPIAPIEDLSYTIAAMLVIPAVWTWLGRPRSNPAKEEDA